MDFKKVLTEKKDGILKRWFHRIAESYPPDTASFLKRRNAPFTNPVGHTISEGLAGIYDALLQGIIPDSITAFLDSIIRIRAVQDFTPSQAVAFVFMLKGAVREELEAEIQQSLVSSEDLIELESAIDDLALYAFDVYMKCREQIYDIKAKEARSATFRLLQRAGIIGENPG